MKDDEKTEIKDPIELKIFEALANPKWDFRTITGISKNTGIDEDKVKATLDKYPNLIRISPIQDERGRTLYTLRKRIPTFREGIAMAQRVLSKSV